MWSMKCGGIKCWVSSVGVSSVGYEMRVMKCGGMKCGV